MSVRFPPAEPHGTLVDVLPGLHLVQGSMHLGPARFSRNMVVIQRGDDLVLVNTVRLDAGGLEALDGLGRVTDIVRLAHGHGRDDPFYKARYGATVWDMAGMRYFKGVRWNKGATYFRSDHQLDGETCPPLPGARLFHLGTVPPEAVLWLPHAGGTLIAGDALHNWGTPHGHFNLPGRLLFRCMGLIGPHRFGKGVLDICRPAPARLRALLDLGWDHLLPAHGDAVLGDAPAQYEAALAAYVRQRG